MCASTNQLNFDLLCASIELTELKILIGSIYMDVTRHCQTHAVTFKFDRNILKTPQTTSVT